MVHGSGKGLKVVSDVQGPARLKNPGLGLALLGSGMKNLGAAWSTACAGLRLGLGLSPGFIARIDLNKHIVTIINI